MFTQLNPPIPIEAIGKGKGMAFGLIDYGQEHNLIWLIGVDETREIWCVPNPEVRLQPKWTMGRRKTISTPECKQSKSAEKLS